MAIVRGLDGRFFDIDDEILSKYEIKAENIPPDLGAPPSEQIEAPQALISTTPWNNWHNWQNWSHPWKQQGP